MQAHPLGIVHGVKDLEEVVSFLRDQLGMPLVNKTAEFALFDNASLSVRLVRGLNTPAPVALDLHTQDLAASAEQFRKLSGFQVHAAEWLTPIRQVVRVDTPYGLTLYMGRDLNEDELGIPDEIPMELAWSEEAVSVVQSLVQHVPLAFRQQARKKTAHQAERIAISQGQLEVDRDLAIRSLIRITPSFQEEALRSELLRLGFNVADYEAEFLGSP